MSFKFLHLLLRKNQKHLHEILKKMIYSASHGSVVLTGQFSFTFFSIIRLLKTFPHGVLKVFRRFKGYSAKNVQITFAVNAPIWNKYLESS